MYLSKLSHNDLHLGNVRLANDLSKDEKIFTYTTDTNTRIDITFDCDMKAMIYDFDRSYSPIIGWNDFITDDCDIRTDCNLVREGYDFSYFMIWLIQIECKGLCNYITLSILLSIVAKDATEFNKIVSILNLTINHTTKTVTPPAMFKHPIECMNFQYKSYDNMLTQLNNEIAVNINQAKASVNNNTVFKRDFDKKSGKLLNVYNNKDCNKKRKRRRRNP